MTIEENLAQVSGALTACQITSLENERKIERLTADLSVAQTLAEEAQAKLADMTAKYTAVEAENATLKAEAKCAADRAQEIVASLGVPPVHIIDHATSQSATSETKTRGQLIAEMNTITDPIARANFIKNHNL